MKLEACHINLPDWKSPDASTEKYRPERSSKQHIAVIHLIKNWREPLAPDPVDSTKVLNPTLFLTQRELSPSLPNG